MLWMLLQSSGKANSLVSGLLERPTKPLWRFCVGAELLVLTLTSLLVQFHGHELGPETNTNGRTPRSCVWRAEFLGYLQSYEENGERCAGGQLWGSFVGSVSARSTVSSGSLSAFLPSACLAVYLFRYMFACVFTFNKLFYPKQNWFLCRPFDHTGALLNWTCPAPNAKGASSRNVFLTEPLMENGVHLQKVFL